MKKYLSIIVGLCLIGMIAFVCFTGKKEENDLRKIRVAEVTHSPFYTPFYVAIENGYFKEDNKGAGEKSLLYFFIILCFVIGAIAGNFFVKVFNERAIAFDSLFLFAALVVLSIDLRNNK